MEQRLRWNGWARSFLYTLHPAPLNFSHDITFTSNRVPCTAKDETAPICRCIFHGQSDSDHLAYNTTVNLMIERSTHRFLSVEYQLDIDWISCLPHGQVRLLRYLSRLPNTGTRRTAVVICNLS
ncbi:hypothetical protein M378DRAFT_549332 [Amanita muscaria Koide BX008]|uniref:Uncharacterized protein n=1 Tax=Amanita muscaria (strain Koide BX008) TaxID=946122 RepID=A0A0C2WIL9_AMAMK|nr:hypothetical protein M378DRAFT_549332 [Amanita muscaria Koide BX008]